MYPWHVSLTMITPYGNMFCGGSIINSTFIITAAHCVVDMMAFDVHEYLSVRVGAGQLYLNACSPNQQEIYVCILWWWKHCISFLIHLAYIFWELFHEEHPVKFSIKLIIWPEVAFGFISKLIRMLMITKHNFTLNKVHTS